MTDREQSSNEAAIRNVLDNQFRTLTDQIISNLERLSMFGERWPTAILVLAGGTLLLFSLAMKIDFLRLGYLRAMEFITLIIVGSGAMVVGVLFWLYQARGWRKIIQAQQAVGIEILNKQIETERDSLSGKHVNQRGELILLPAKIRKRGRR